MLIAHLSDLHLRDAGDATWLERQLDRIAARSPDHLAITGDLLDRWLPATLERVLDALDARGLLDADRLTILHGNHDLASGGGHPRRGVDLWRLALRFWDPPPLVRWRRRRFYAQLRARVRGLGSEAPFMKTIGNGARIAVVDSVPVPWRPFDLERRTIVVRHAIGCARAPQVSWLAAQPREEGPLILLMHHYPLSTPAFQWSPEHPALSATRIAVPMQVPDADRARLWSAVKMAGVRLVLCGHVHRARLEHHDGVAVGLNGQSGAAWAGHTIAYYELDAREVRMEIERGMS